VYDGIKVAVKLLLPSNKASCRELAMYHRLASDPAPSPYIVRYLGSWEGDRTEDKQREDKHLILVLERCDTDLNSFLHANASTLPMPKGIFFLLNICSGLQSMI
jgi:hypothetical protein